MVMLIPIRRSDKVFLSLQSIVDDFYKIWPNLYIKIHNPLSLLNFSFLARLLLNLGTVGSASSAESARHSALTDRQIEVLRLLSDGLSNKEIGRALGLSDKTVKTHVGAIFKTLAVVNRTQAASAARRAALL